MLTQSYLSLKTGHLKPMEKWACEGDELFLIFPKGGTYQISAYNTNLKFAAGDMAVVSGRAAAKLTVLTEGADNEAGFSWFSVSLDSLFPLFAAGEISFLQNIMQEFRVPKVYGKALPMVTQCRQILGELGGKVDLHHRSQLLRIMAVFLSTELKSLQQQQGGYESAEDHMLRVFEQLSSHELLNLSVEELSQKFGCSRRHLSRLFHQRFGLSVASLRMEMRLLKASSLLRDPGVKVINVAEQCGFNHLGLFNTCFKRRFGMTPGVWRSQQNDRIKSGKPAHLVDTCPLQVNGLCPWNGKPEKSGGVNGVSSELSKVLESKVVGRTLVAGATAASKTSSRPICGQAAA